MRINLILFHSNRVRRTTEEEMHFPQDWMKSKINGIAQTVIRIFPKRKSPSGKA